MWGSRAVRAWDPPPCRLIVRIRLLAMTAGRVGTNGEDHAQSARLRLAGAGTDGQFGP